MRNLKDDVGPIQFVQRYPIVSSTLQKGLLALIANLFSDIIKLNAMINFMELSTGILSYQFSMLCTSA